MKTIDNLIEEAKTTGQKKRLLLHVCCAPCLCGAIERVLPYFDVTAYFYNPNISPKSEFINRIDAFKTLLLQFSDLQLIIPEQDINEFYTVADGLEKEPEGGTRCTECFKLRLSKTAEYYAVHRNDYDCFATTLTVSPHKNARLINSIGNECANQYKIVYAASDFKKQNGFLRSTILSKELGIYRQDYCGCDFSNWHLS